MKVYKVTGEISKPNLNTTFKQEIIAAKPEHAVEKIYAELGSRHRLKRYHIKIISVEEIPSDQIDNPALKRIITGEKDIGKQS